MMNGSITDIRNAIIKIKGKSEVPRASSPWLLCDANQRKRCANFRGSAPINSAGYSRFACTPRDVLLCPFLPRDTRLLALRVPRVRARSTRADFRDGSFAAPTCRGFNVVECGPGGCYELNEAIFRLIRIPP